MAVVPDCRAANAAPPRSTFGVDPASRRTDGYRSDAVRLFSEVPLTSYSYYDWVGSSWVGSSTPSGIIIFAARFDVGARAHSDVTKDLGRVSAAATFRTIPDSKRGGVGGVLASEAAGWHQPRDVT